MKTAQRMVDEAAAKAIGSEKNAEKLKKIADALKSLAQRVKDFFKGIGSKPANKVIDDSDAVMKLAEMFSQAADKARESMESYGEEKNESEGRRYEVKEDINGEKFVEVDPSIYDNTDGASVASVIRSIIQEKYHNLLEVNGQKIQINKTTNDEWRMSKSAQYIEKTNPTAYDDKLHAIGNADELLKAANDWIGESIKHVRKDDIVEFGRAKVLYRVNNNGYEADVIVGIRQNGAAVLYDIKNIYSKKITEASRVTKASKYSLRTPTTSVTSMLSQSNENVKFSVDGTVSDRDYLSAVKRGDMKTVQRMVDEAAERAFADSKIRSEGGKLLKVYHGSDADFTVFDRTKGRANMDIQGMFFSPWEIDAGGYGENIRAFYLNIINPASERTGFRALNSHKGENYAGRKACEDLERMGYDGVNNEDEEFIAFYSEQIKSADPVTYDNDGRVIPLSERFNLSNPDIRHSVDDAIDPEKKQEIVSIKNQIRNAQDKLNKMEVVAKVSSVETFGKYKSEVETYLKHNSFEGIIHRDDIGEIVFNSKTIHKGLKYANNEAEKAAILAVPMVIKRGAIINDGNVNHKNRGFATITIGAPVTIDDQRGNMGVVIKKTDKNRYSAHRILTPDGTMFFLDKEKDTEVTNTGSTIESNSPRPDITSASEEIVAQEKGEVKQLNEDLKFSVDDTIYDYITDEYSLDGGRLTKHEGVKELMVMDIEHFAERVKNAARGSKLEYDYRSSNGVWQARYIPPEHFTV